MNRNWLVVDVNNMAWRAFLTTGGLSHKAKGRMQPTGVLYGFFQSLQHLCSQHNSRDLVFCFDRGVSLRKKALEGYKAKRHSRPLTDDQKVNIAAMKAQVENLRTKWLPKLGYRNVFSAPGYEGDDVIASVVRNLKKRKGTDVIVVSADKDLYQLLDENVWMWDPIAKRMHSAQSFFDQYNLMPEDWPTVKALAGCSTDEIPGIKGVGEKTAVKYVNGGKTTEREVKLIETNWSTVDANLPLVKLPYKGCPKFKPVDCEVDLGQWRLMCDKLGFRSLRDRPPGGGGGFGLKHNPIARA